MGPEALIYHFWDFIICKTIYNLQTVFQPLTHWVFLRSLLLPLLKIGFIIPQFCIRRDYSSHVEVTCTSYAAGKEGSEFRCVGPLGQHSFHITSLNIIAHTELTRLNYKFLSSHYLK